MISEIDQDANGAISFDEFVWLMTRLCLILSYVSFYSSFSSYFMFQVFLNFTFPIPERFMIQILRKKSEKHSECLTETAMAL